MQNVILAIALLGQAIDTAGKLQQLIAKANGENRDITDDEMAEVLQRNDDALKRLIEQQENYTD